MVRQQSTNWMSQEMRNHLESNAYALKMFQNEENTQADYTLRDFLEFIESDSDDEFTTPELDKIRKAVQEYLGYSLEQVKRAELEKLAQWKG